MLLMVFLFPSLALSEEVLWYDLVETDSLYYKKFTDVPFSGEVTGQGQGQIKDGKHEGIWLFYHDNGQLWFKGAYNKGKADGLHVYYPPTTRSRARGEVRG